MNDEELLALSASLTKRSSRARRSACVATIMIILTVFVMIFFFYGNSITSRYVLSEISSLKSQNDELISVVRKDEPENIVKMRLELEKSKAELDLKLVEIEKASEEASRNARTITDSVTKIGAVLIAIYLVQILLSLMRYHFKLADHIETISESLKISKGDLEKLERANVVIGVSHIDFGKSPQTPIDKITEVIKELGDKVAKLSPNK